jgi:lysozyme
MKLLITESQYKSILNMLNEAASEDPSFIDYIVSVEGKVLDDDGLHKAYKDSKGIWTIGYGHAKTGDSKVKPGLKITEKKARELLKKDLVKFEQQVRDYISRNYSGKTLDTHQLQMLTDFAFNLGDLGKFPKFVKSVVYKDWETAKKNYKRYAGGKELTDRNKKFFDKFLKNAEILSNVDKSVDNPMNKNIEKSFRGTYVSTPDATNVSQPNIVDIDK